MAGRDEEFQKNLEQMIAQARANGGDGAVDLSALSSGPPDPRQFPMTVSEITFRQCWHKFERIIDPDGNFLYFRMSIVDPVDRKVYHYGFADDVLADMLETLGEMRDNLKDPSPVEDASDDV